MAHPGASPLERRPHNGRRVERRTHQGVSHNAPDRGCPSPYVSRLYLGCRTLLGDGSKCGRAPTSGTGLTRAYLDGLRSPRESGQQRNWTSLFEGCGSTDPIGSSSPSTPTVNISWEGGDGVPWGERGDKPAVPLLLRTVFTALGNCASIPVIPERRLWVAYGALATVRIRLPDEPPCHQYRRRSRQQGPR